MANTEQASKAVGNVYSLEGTLIEACSCGVNCPCWIGEDPDLGECFAIVAYGIESGTIGALDVSNLSLVVIAHIPGNVLAGNWQVVALLDDRATEEQRRALLAAFTGELGGPLGDLWENMIGAVRGVEIVPISHRVVGAPERSASPGSWRRRSSPSAVRTAA